ncbi:MAG: class I SAM-dependent methyltransferase [Vicinamibacterales bacterium]
MPNGLDRTRTIADDGCGLNPVRFRAALDAALAIRAPLQAAPHLTVYRIADGAGDDLPGISIDRYGPAVVLNVYDDARLSDPAVTVAAQTTLETLRASGVASVYVKRFARDRSRLGGQAPKESRAAQPRAGVMQPETLIVQEYDSQFEVRLYDGFSTGLFLEHREHRRAFADAKPARVLNLFAYTCAFAVPLVAAGAHVTNVDVSSRYLAWGRRNLALNRLPTDRARFSRMDAFAFLAWAAKRDTERFDLVIVDPPTFAAGDAREKRRPWKAVDDYPALVQAAARVVAPGGRIFAASNTRELASTDTLHHIVEQALGRRPAWLALPPWPIDVREPGRVAAVMFAP